MDASKIKHVERDPVTGRVSFSFSPHSFLAHAHQFGRFFSGEDSTDAANWNELVEMFSPLAVDHLKMGTGVNLILFRDRSGVIVAEDMNSQMRCAAFEPGRFEIAFKILTANPTLRNLHNLLNNPESIGAPAGNVVVGPWGVAGSA